MSALRRPTVHFSRGWKLLLYSVLLLSFATGAGWFVLDRWFFTVDEFDIVQKHPLEPVLLKIHGASAMLVLVSFGYLLATHVHAAWRTHRQRGSGLPLVAIFVLMAASGWCLYYIADVTWRARIAWLHLGTGLSLPILLATHIITGHHSARKA
jgi:hypothetical protein